MSKLDTPEHAGYRAEILAYGQSGDDPHVLGLRVQALEADLLEMERLYLEADALAWECERRHGEVAS